MVISSRMRLASGPLSSNDCGRATPPVTTIFTCGRTASSLAMLSALVTTVSPGSSDPFSSGRTASARAISVVVVPPFSPTTPPRATSAAAPRPIRTFSGACRAVL